MRWPASPRDRKARRWTCPGIELTSNFAIALSHHQKTLARNLNWGEDKLLVAGHEKGSGAGGRLSLEWSSDWHLSAMGTTWCSGVTSRCLMSWMSSFSLRGVYGDLVKFVKVHLRLLMNPTQIVLYKILKLLRQYEQHMWTVTCAETDREKLFKSSVVQTQLWDSFKVIHEFFQEEANRSKMFQQVSFRRLTSNLGQFQMQDPSVSCGSPRVIHLLDSNRCVGPWNGDILRGGVSGDCASQGLGGWEGGGDQDHARTQTYRWRPLLLRNRKELPSRKLVVLQ